MKAALFQDAIAERYAASTDQLTRFLSTGEAGNKILHSELMNVQIILGCLLTSIR